MLKFTPERVNFERVVVEPIKNGFLVHISTDSDEEVYSFKTFRQMTSGLKQLLKTVSEEEENS